MSSETEKQQRAAQVRAMFSRIVPRYDLMNRLMTGGQDGRWRHATARAVAPRGAVALDLATGTADLAIELRRQGARAVVGADFAAPMLAAAAEKVATTGATRITLVEADALALPFGDATFDCVTSAFLLRNVVDIAGCLAEMRRVLRPGGRAVALDVTHMPAGLRSRAFRLYFRGIVPRLGALITGDGAAYTYLPASLDRFPDADALAALFSNVGFVDVSYQLVGFGALAIHRGVAPG